MVLIVLIQTGYRYFLNSKNGYYFYYLLLVTRLSQDLAKDLAILAQEIHDVAGDSEAQSASTDKMGPAISTHEEVPFIMFLYSTRLHYI